MTLQSSCSASVNVDTPSAASIYPSINVRSPERAGVPKTAQGWRKPPGRLGLGPSARLPTWPNENSRPAMRNFASVPKLKPVTALSAEGLTKCGTMVVAQPRTKSGPHHSGSVGSWRARAGKGHLSSMRCCYENHGLCPSAACAWPDKANEAPGCCVSDRLGSWAGAEQGQRPAHSPRNSQSTRRGSNAGKTESALTIAVSTPLAPQEEAR
jgi:hypothetical protein